MINIPFAQVKETLKEILLRNGFHDEKAEILATIHTQSNVDGVFSHGLNRFPLFIEYVRKGIVKPDAEPTLIHRLGMIEQWDGNYGPGIWNAWQSTQRAIRLASEHGIGLVTLRNTNHWMRGGTYGWQMAEAGKIGICFTNTQPNMPPWGGKESRTGNNPLIIAVPRKQGAHMVLDMSLSQFSFGKINQYLLEGQELPFPGGWDEHDQLSRDPEKILKKERGLPIGYWKGSALSIMLDTLATILSMGNSTAQVGLNNYEAGVSQVFLCIDPKNFGDEKLQEEMKEQIIGNIHEVPTMKEGKKTRYPGEDTLDRRKLNVKKGVPVNEPVWQKILSL